MKTSAMMGLVSQIPVDQKAKATPTIKSFLLAKLRLIQSNRQTIERAAIDKRTEEILEAYRKNVGFRAKLKSILSLREKLEKAELELFSLGLTEGGEIVSTSKHATAQGTEYQTYSASKGRWIDLDSSTAAKIENVKKLIDAVQGEVETFTAYDQLETRMMMASTVGEAMVIVNAVVGQPVFMIEKKALAIKDKGE